MTKNFWEKTYNIVLWTFLVGDNIINTIVLANWWTGSISKFPVISALALAAFGFLIGSMTWGKIDELVYRARIKRYYSTFK